MLEDYVDVAERLQDFFNKYPEGSLQPLDPTKPYTLEFAMTDFEPLDIRLVYTAAAYRTPDDQRPGIGTAWEMVPGKTAYTKGSELMVAETSAWGRALAALGFATKRIATAQEVKAAESRRVERVVKPQAPIEDPWNEPLLKPAAHTCAHGDRKRISGKNPKGEYVGWVCPLDKSDPNRCAPEWE